MSSQSISQTAFTPDTMIPDLLRSYPEARLVLDRFGLSGCGGRFGPAETLRFFARAHGVDERQLLLELGELLSKDECCRKQLLSVAASDRPDVADTIYRRFFVAGILVVLTLGASWGALLLWRIGLGGSFTSASLFEINAHGQAQIFGWMGLFIMGFAYQAFPRFWQTTLVAPQLALVSFILMVAGVVLSTIGMIITGRCLHALPLAAAGGTMEVAASLIFAGQILATFTGSKAKLEPYIGFIFAALGWYVLSTSASAWHTWNTMTAVSRESLLWYVATFQAPLRDIQIHGLAMSMIFGVSLRTMPALFGLSRIPDRRSWWALALLTAAVVAEVALFIAYRLSHNQVLAALLVIPWLMLVVATVMVALPWKLWRPFPEPDRSSKFIRAAYAWLTVSLIMLLLLPVYQAVSHIAFSHAYYGAIRHAITVGFVSLMIMGYAAKVVPTLNGVDPRRLPSLWGPFILVNLGCLLRVTTQTLTDWYHSIFAIVGISGMLEVAGLAWWGIGLIQIIWQGKREMEKEPVSELAAISEKPEEIEPDHHVADVLDWFPETEPVFERYGFGAIKNPVMRKTVARTVSVAQASRMHNVPSEEFVAALNAAIATPGRHDQPIACCRCCREAPPETAH